MREALVKYDTDKDGKINEAEVTRLVEDLVDLETARKFYRRMLLAAVIIVVVLLAATFGLTWAVVASVVDTRISNNVLTARDTKLPVRTAALEFNVLEGGILAARSANATNTTSSDELSTDGAAALPELVTTIKTAPLLVYGTPRPDMGINTLNSLKNIVIKSMDGNEISLAVEGVAVLGEEGSITKPRVVKLLTPVGLVVLDGSDRLGFEGLSANGQALLEAANFAVDGSTRRLLSSAKITGAFTNTAADLLVEPAQPNDGGGNGGNANANVGAGGDPGVGRDVLARRYIIEFADDVNPKDIRGRARGIAQRLGVDVSHIFESAIKGLSIVIPANVPEDVVLRQLKGNSTIKSVVPDRAVRALGMMAVDAGEAARSPGVLRIGATRKTATGTYESYGKATVGVAVIDTGIR